MMLPLVIAVMPEHKTDYTPLPAFSMQVGGRYRMSGACMTHAV